MAPLRLAISIALLFICSIASAADYQWITSKLQQRLDSEEKPISTVGKIDGQNYLVAQINAADNNSEEFKPVLVVAKVTKGKTYEPMAIWRLDKLPAFNVKIENNSIYFRGDTAHHGVYFTRYQFKLKDSNFILTALERQSITPVASNKDQYINKELWEGQEIDFQNSRSKHWAEAFDLRNPKRRQAWQSALKKHERGLPSLHASHTTVILKIDRQWGIEDFDFDTFDSHIPNYYFDGNLKFHKPKEPASWG